MKNAANRGLSIVIAAFFVIMKSVIFYATEAGETRKRYH